MPADTIRQNKAHQVLFLPEREQEIKMNQNITGTILLIDDEAPVRDAVRDILDMEGWVVLAADSGERGLQLFAQHQTEIVLVILDMSMPGLSGTDTLHLLRQMDKQVKVLVSSGYSQFDLTEKIAKQNITGFLQKPYNAMKLINTIRYYLP